MSVNHIVAVDARTLADAKVFDRWYERMPPERKGKIDRMKFDKGKRLSLAAGVAMEEALRLVGCDSIPPSAWTDDNGKLHVDGGVYFNLSHTEDVAVCAISDREVGIDIECPRKFDDSLIKYTFSEDEVSLAEGMMRAILATSSEIGHSAADKNVSSFHKDIPDSIVNRVYTRLWTIKESTMKWTGRGLGLSPKLIEIYDSLDRLRVNIDTEEYREVSNRLYFTEYEFRLPYDNSPDDMYHISVCSEYNNFVGGVEWFNTIGGKYG